jgi:hypothetical protein
MAREGPGGGHCWDVGNDRVPRGSPLGGINTRDGLRVEGIGPQPVDRFRGERHQCAGAQLLGGRGNEMRFRVLRIDGDDGHGRKVAEPGCRPLLLGLNGLLGDAVHEAW